MGRCRSANAAGLTVEVKSSAFIQGWHQAKPPKIVFSTRRTRDWNADTGKLDKIAKRHADIYLFALRCHLDQDTLDPLNVARWRFWILPTAELDKRGVNSIALKSLERLTSAVGF